MMFERKCTVEPQDVIALEFLCGSCGAASTIPIQQITASGVSRTAQGNCHYCGTDNLFAPDTAELKNLTAFVSATAEMARAMQGRNMQVKLVVRCAQ